MKIFYISLTLLFSLFIGTAVSAQPWWGENIIHVQVNAGNGYLDECIIYFIPGGHTFYDAFYDAQKLPGGVDRPFVFSMKNYQDTTTLGVNGFPSITQDYNIPLGFKPGYTGNHTFTFADSNSIHLPIVVYLEDLVNHTYTNVTANPVFNFTATIGDNGYHRFILHVRGPVYTSTTSAGCGGGGSVIIADSSSSQWQSYELRTNPGNTLVTSGQYALPTTITGIAAGLYNLKLTNPYGLTYTMPVTVGSGGSTVTASLTTQTNVGCSDGNTGSATVNATGGSGNYTVTWNTTPTQTGPTATNLAAGNYIATISDGSCQDTVHVHITAAAAVSASLVTHTDVTCGGSLGSATVSGTGGNGTFQISWNTNPVQTGPTATNLAAGSYIATVTSGACQDTVHVSIGNSTGVSGTLVSQTDVDCSGNLGSATVSGSGGSGSLQITWNTTPSQTGATASNLPAGTYIATITDGVCQDTVQVNIGFIPPIHVNATAANDSAYVDSLLTFAAQFNSDSITWNFGDGSAVVTTTQISTSHSFSQAGTYTVIVTTPAGPCADADTITITVTTPVGINEIKDGPAAQVWLGGGKLNIKYNSNAALAIAIYNTAGQLVDSFASVQGTNGLYVVNTKPTPTGIYYININDGTNRLARKVGVWN